MIIRDSSQENPIGKTEHGGENDLMSIKGLSWSGQVGRAALLL